MKNSKLIIKFVFFSFLSVFYIFSSCRNNFEPLPVNKLSAGTGALSLSIGDQSAERTIIPTTVLNDFCKFELEFTAKTAGNIDFHETWENSSGTLAINAGIWDISVTAYFNGDGGAFLEAAQGLCKGIVIPSKNTVAANIQLLPLSTGRGTFCWNISYPENVISASMEIIRLDKDLAPYQELFYFIGEAALEETGNLNLDSGQYRIVFRFSNGEEDASFSEILHIYKNMESSFTEAFTNKYFPLSLLKIILGAWDDTTKEWNLSAAGINAEHLSLAGISGISSSNFDTVVSRCNVLCSSISVPGNVAELKVLVDTALISIAAENGNFNNANNYDDLNAAQAAIAQTAANKTTVSFEWEPDNKTVYAQTTVNIIEIIFNAPVGAASLSFTLIKNSTAYSVSKCQSSALKAVIPAVYDSLPVTVISGTAFIGCTGLTSITIPDSVTSIDNFAFSSCTGLTSITIPNSVTSIGNHTFYYCSGLTSITVDSGNTAYYSEGNCLIQRSNNVLLVGCKNSVIPNSVTSIGDSAFINCTDLTSITIPNSVTSISFDAFASCSGLTSVTIPNSVTSIGDSAFSSCSGLTSVTITDSVTSIGYNAFSGCTSLTSITIPDSVTSIGNSAFGNCSGLTSITVDSGNTAYYSEGNCLIQRSNNVLLAGCKNSVIPNSVTSIGNSAFGNCSGLTSIIIPNSVTSIGNVAFSSCSGLTSVAIPNSVTSIGTQAFRGCSDLTKVFYSGLDNSAWTLIAIGTNNTELTSATRYYYSATHPGTANTHWRWVEGEPVVWE